MLDACADVLTLSIMMPLVPPFSATDLIRPDNWYVLFLEAGMVTLITDQFPHRLGQPLISAARKSGEPFFHEDSPAAITPLQS